MTRAAELHERDRRKAERIFGKYNCAFVAPELPKPKTPAERIARSIVDERFERCLTVHIYDVHEALEEAFRLGAATKEAK